MDTDLIDIHTHILPGVDDGAKDLEQAIAIAKVAAQDGIKSLVATPHVIGGAFENHREDIIKKVKNLNLCLQVQQINLRILPGAEYYLEPDLPERLKAGELLTINDSGRYLLLEFPATLVPAGTGNILQALVSQGITPIIAHPERNRHILNHPEIMERLAARGILAQVTSISITGANGTGSKEMALRFLQTGVAQIVASDAHSVRTRSPLLTPAFREIERLWGHKFASTVFCQNPWRVVKGRPIMEAAPLAPLGNSQPKPPAKNDTLLKRLWGHSFIRP